MQFRQARRVVPVAISALAFAAPALAANVVCPNLYPVLPWEEIPAHTRGELLVRFNDNVDIHSLQQFHAQLGTQGEVLSEALNAERVFFDPNIDIEVMARRLLASPLVEYVEPNYVGHVLHVPNDPMYVETGKWNSVYTAAAYHLFPIDAEHGWDAARGTDVVIAHIDTGLDFDHPEFTGQLWTNDDEIPNNGVDDDGNGYKDDVHGMDFVGNNVGKLIEILFPLLYNTKDSNPDVHETGNDGWGVPDPSIGNGIDDNFDGYADIAVSHGTMTAGATFSVMDDALGMPGVAPEAKIMPLRAINAEGMGLFSDVIDAIDYATDNGADIINMSLGWPIEGRLLREACERAYGNGVVIICASGNAAHDGISDGVAYPGGWPTTLAVGAGNTSFHRSEYSDFGPGLDVLAPGGDVVGTSFTEIFWSPWVASMADENDGIAPMGTPGWAGGAGTSFSSPVVAGLAALFLDRYPGASPAQVYQAFRTRSIDVGPTGWDEETGYGMVNARRLLGLTQGKVAGFISPERQKMAPGVEYQSNVVLVNDDAVAHTVDFEVNLYDHDRQLIPTYSPLDQGPATLAAGAPLRASFSHPTHWGMPQGVYFISIEVFENGQRIDYDDFALNFTIATE
jgi:subtilisin family serine protease